MIIRHQSVEARISYADFRVFSESGESVLTGMCVDCEGLAKYGDSGMALREGKVWAVERVYYSRDNFLYPLSWGEYCAEGRKDCLVVSGILVLNGENKSGDGCCRVFSPVVVGEGGCEKRLRSEISPALLIKINEERERRNAIGGILRAVLDSKKE